MVDYGKFDGGAAFPYSGHHSRREQDGMSLRDWYAGQCLPVMITAKHGRLPETNAEREHVAISCYAMADAMITELQWAAQQRLKERRGHDGSSV